MQYARDRRTKRIVHADKVRRTERSRAYECPVCTAAVHYKTAIGLSPYPGFAHNAHAGRLDCDLYHPSFGSGTSGVGIETLEETKTSEFDLCLDDQQNWSLFLRFPEISDLGDTRLGTLAAGSVNVVTGSDSRSIPLIELRPGVGCGRLVIPPSVNPYDATPSGKWPSAVLSDRWMGSCSGLNPRGTPFVLCNGEWERLAIGAELRLGNELRIVAEATNAPPAMYSSASAAVISHNKVTWRMWRVSLPNVISNSLSQWAEAIGVDIAQPVDELSLLGVPCRSGPDGTIFAINHRLIAKVKWSPDEAPATLSVRTSRGSESSSAWPVQDSPTYLALSVRDAAITTLTANYDRRSSLSIATVAEPTPEELRKQLNAVQPLQIQIGDTSIAAWQESVSLRPALGQAAFPSFTISPDYESLRFDMQWTTEDGIKYDFDLTSQMVQNRLMACWGRDADLQISAGAFGSVRLSFRRFERSRTSMSASRVLRWVVLANSGAELRTNSWIRGSLAATKSGLLRGRTLGTSPRWAPVLVNEMKRLKKRI
jgi:hypothetical protein